MMKRLTATGLFFFSVFAVSQAQAAGFYYGEETKGITVSANESDLNVRIRLQPRMDFGDIIIAKDGKSYATDKDFYFRRVRLEAGGHLVKTFKYHLALAGDKWDKTGNSNAVIVHTAYVEWEPIEPVSVIFGKEKLPYSRVSLTSSSKRLLVENPASTEAAKKLFGKTDPYYQPKFAVKGKILDGVIAYEAAVADGWANGEAVQTTPARAVYKSKPLYVARVEFSPPNFVEGKKSDAHLGSGRHLTLGLNYANQSSIEYSTTADNRESRILKGLDLSGHYNGLTAQFEFNEWKVETSDRAVANSHPKGWYAQAGYFIEGINIEPAARYEIYNQDSKQRDMAEKDTTLGVNWYGKGHSLKAGLNWVNTKYETFAGGRLTNANKKNVYQLQAQMYF
ncbi:MAG: hypothetical protein HY884_03600 [Deltaproteobacteria bacterium]|nr:hypothetical protein [Deltaproteobacteria bacterium]